MAGVPAAELPSGSDGEARDGKSIDLARRAHQIEAEVDDDVCSICLEEFSEQDPGQSTCCR